MGAPAIIIGRDVHDVQVETARIDEQLRQRLTALASTLAAMAECVAELFSSDVDPAAADAEIRRLNRESAAYSRFIAATLDAPGATRSDLKAVATFLGAAGEAAASSSSRYAVLTHRDRSAAAGAQGRILADVTRRIERAVSRLDDVDAVRSLASEIGELEQRGSEAYTEALNALDARTTVTHAQRWRSVHGRLALSIDRCGHVGRALERLVPVEN